MDATTDELDELLVRDAQLQALVTPVWVLAALTVAATLGLVVHAAAMSVTCWIGSWLVGPWVISRAAPLLRTPPLLKYLLFLSCAMPPLSLAAPLYLWQACRSTRDEVQTRARERQARARRRASAPVAAPAAAPTVAAANVAAPVAPVQAALPVLRAVSAGMGDGRELEVRITDPATAAKAPGASLPPLRSALDMFAVGYHVDAGSHWTSFTRDDMKAAGLDLNALHRQALSNLMKLAKGKPGLRLVEGHAYHGVLLDGDHEACLVLLDGIWEALFADKTPNGAVVSIPTRDVLAFCDARSAEGIAALREANARLSDAKGAVFQGLLLRRDGRWSVLD